jgi:transposase
LDNDQFWAGIDLGLRESRLCVVDAEGLPVFEQSCETSAQSIYDLLSEIGTDRIGLIATEAGSDTYVVRKLKGMGLPVALFECRKASRFLAVRRNKTDASDARGLADLARLGRHTVSQVYLKSLDCQQLRSQLVMRHRLVRLRVAAEGALRSRLALHGRSLKKAYTPGVIREWVAVQLAQLKAEDGVDLREDLEPIVEFCESLRTYLRKVDRDLQKQADSHPVCSRLMEVTGVGPICSLSFYSAIEDPTRFSTSEGVAAYLGLVPRRYQSGEVSYTRGITKTGNKLTRAHLVNAAMIFSSRGPDSALKQWSATLKERVGTRRSRVALARKLAIVLLTMWKNQTHFEPYPSPIPK